MAFMLLACLVLIALCKAFPGYTVSCPSNSSLPSNTSAVSIAKLPAAYSKVGYPQNPTVIEQIRNTLALYSLAVDGKDFGALDLVFTQDVVANYSAPLNVLSPLSTLKSEVQGSLAYVTTQHKLSTQVIEIMPSGCEAKSLTYVEATLFGQGHYEGQIVSLYAQTSEKEALQTMSRSISRVIIAVNPGTCRYHDYWIQQPTRQWRIVARTVTYMAPLIGSQATFQPS